MRLLILSDIHGNKFGLEAVLEVGRKCAGVICLGDIVGYGAHPNECCEMLRRVKARCLSGNHDAAALGKIDTTWFNPIAKAAIDWTAEHLTPGNRTWLDSLPGEAIMASQHFQAVHASLRQSWHEYIVDPSIALPTMDLMRQPVCFYGHTHEADVYCLPSGAAGEENLEHRYLPGGGRIQLQPNFKYLINPGSCGQPRDNDPRAKCAIFDLEKRTVEILAIDYDYFGACAAILDAGLPEVLGERLFVGK